MSKDIEKKIADYRRDFEFHEVGTPLILVAEVLIEINRNLEEIAKKISK